MTARLLAWLSGGAVCVGTVVATSYFTFTVDDAYIVLRYGRNLISEGQLAFNIGEPVSALTSPLHGVLTAALVAVSEAHALHFSKIVMIVFLVVTAGQLINLDRTDARRRLLILTVLCASPFVWMWTVGGLETMLVMWVITSMATLYPRSNERRLFLALNALAGVAFLARYDTVFFVLPVLAGLWWKTWRRDGGAAVVTGMCLSALLPMAWLAFSVYYFHDLFPTSFYAKATRDIAWFKVRYMGQFLLVTGLLPVWLLGLAFIWRRGHTHQLRTYIVKHGPLFVGLLAVAAYGSAHATVHMMFGYRLLLPYLPVMLLLGIELLDIADDSDAGRVSVNTGVIVVAGLLLLTQVSQAMAVYSRSLGGIGITGEFRAMGLSAYRTAFLPVMDSGCRDLQSHIQTTPRFETRPPRFSTFAEGYIPYCERSLYVYGHLVSYRHSVNEGWPAQPVFQRSADYIYILTPRHGSIVDLLPLPVEHFELISSHAIEYDGGNETFAIYYNPSPDDVQLPRYVR